MIKMVFYLNVTGKDNSNFKPKQTNEQDVLGLRFVGFVALNGYAYGFSVWNIIFSAEEIVRIHNYFPHCDSLYLCQLHRQKSFT